MPTLPPVARAAISTISGTIGVANWTNRFFWLWDTAPTITNIQELADQVWTAYTANPLSGMAPEVIATHVITEDLSASPVLPGSHVGSVAGGGAGTIASAQTCILVKHI